MTADQPLCLYCGEPLAVTSQGRKYCSNACRQANWRYAVEQRALVERFGPTEATQDPQFDAETVTIPSPAALPGDHGPSGSVTAPPSRQW
jgi:hypothetical protein